MAKLYFNYSTMNAGKSTMLLQASYNYQERGMRTVQLIAAFDERTGKGIIGSRIGLEASAIAFEGHDRSLCPHQATEQRRRADRLHLRRRGAIS